MSAHNSAIPESSDKIEEYTFLPESMSIQNTNQDEEISNILGK